MRRQLSNGVLFALILAVLLNFLDRANLSTAAPLLQDELKLSNSAMGLLLSSFFWVYTPAQLLGGWLVHRFPVRVALAGGVALWACATMLTGFAGGFASILMLRLLLGLGECVTFPSWQLIVSQQTQEHQKGTVTGFIGSAQGVGPLLGTLLGGLSMARFGWRPMFIGLGLITLLWLWPWFAVTRGGVSTAGGAQTQSLISYGAVLRRGEFWGSALGHFSINYAFYFVTLWLPSFLVKSGGFSIAQMSYIVAGVYGVYALSTAVMGVVSDGWITRGVSPTVVRKSLLITAGCGVAGTIAASAFVGPGVAAWLIGGAGVFMGLATASGFAVSATLAGPRAAGRWAGAQNVAGQIAGAIAPVVTGYLVDRTGTFFSAFLVAGFWALVAAIVWGLMIPKVAEVEWEADATKVACPSLR